MRRTLFRAAIGAVMAIGVIVPTTAQPAQAVDVGTVIKVIKQIYDVYKKFASSGGSGLTLEAAVQQITDAIQGAQTAIIGEIDRVAAADVQACATSAVINFADMDRLTNPQGFALAATDCVTRAKSLAGTVSDLAAVDALGFAMNTVGPLALMARTKTGLSTPDLQAVLVAGENTLIARLLPTCDYVDQSGGEPGAPRYYLWECVAYNGDGGSARARASAENTATRNTSRAAAQDALIQLTS